RAGLGAAPGSSVCVCAPCPASASGREASGEASVWTSPRRRRNGVRNLRPRPRGAADFTSSPGDSPPTPALASLAFEPVSLFISVIFFQVLRFNFFCFRLVVSGGVVPGHEGRVGRHGFGRRGFDQLRPGVVRAASPWLGHAFVRRSFARRGFIGGN